MSSVAWGSAVAHADDAMPSVSLTASRGVTHTLDGSDFTRSPALNPGGINFEDCKRNVQINVPITVSHATAGADLLTVYAGAGCDAYASRQLGTASTSCWPVLKEDVSFEPDVSVSVTLSAKQIVAQLFSTTKTAYADAPDSVCYAQSTRGATQLSLYFVLTDSTRTQTLAVAVSALGADLAAAAPPPGLSVGIGDTLLLPKWTTVVDGDIAGFNVYSLPTSMVAPIKEVRSCRDGGSDAGGDGGDSGDAGDVGACVSETVFDSTPLADGGSIPYDEEGFRCGNPFPVDPNDAVVDGGASATFSTANAGDAGDASISSTAASIAPLALQPREATGAYPFVNVAGNVSSAKISGLTNYKGYAVGVAAIDNYGNVGAITTASGDALCQYPLPITDFWSSYVNAGGAAGGSFCTIGNDASAAGSSFVVVLVATAFVGLGARSRTRRRRADCTELRAPSPRRPSA